MGDSGAPDAHRLQRNFPLDESDSSPVSVVHPDAAHDVIAECADIDFRFDAFYALIRQCFHPFCVEYHNPQITAISCHVYIDKRCMLGIKRNSDSERHPHW